ncbi:MAG: hypothetical protein E3J21_22335 [Anaerolineales bacterium]|nr:MAG: hypothetical protein E3J21_22335 [Anaerolineales bacterium]
MKPPTVFLAEMTNREVEEFLKDHDTVMIPTGSTEQHGPQPELAREIDGIVAAARRDLLK